MGSGVHEESRECRLTLCLNASVLSAFRARISGPLTPTVGKSLLVLSWPISFFSPPREEIISSMLHLTLWVSGLTMVGPFSSLLVINFAVERLVGCQPRPPVSAQGAL